MTEASFGTYRSVAGTGGPSRAAALARSLGHRSAVRIAVPALSQITGYFRERARRRARCRGRIRTVPFAESPAGHRHVPRWLGLLHVVSPRTQRARARPRPCDDLNGSVFRSTELDHTSYARRARVLHRCDGACACELNMRLAFTALAVGGACSGALASSAARSWLTCMRVMSSSATSRNPMRVTP